MLRAASAIFMEIQANETSLFVDFILNFCF